MAYAAPGRRGRARRGCDACLTPGGDREDHADDSTRNSVDLVVTELAVIAFPGGRATLVETAPGVTVGEVIAATEAELVVAAQVPQMQL